MLLLAVLTLLLDKPETAINIGYSCNLLQRNMNLCRIPQIAKSAQDVTNALRDCFGAKSSQDAGNRALVISGEQLSLAIHEAPRAFLEAVLDRYASNSYVMMT